jgi:hypothetical protein
LKNDSKFRFVLAGAATLLVVGSLASACDEDVEATKAPPSTPDSGSDSTTPTSDATTDAAKDASVCAPRDITGFTPSWKPPIAFHQKKCSPTQVATLADCVWTHAGRDDVACKAFYDNAANADCLKCGVTNTTEANYGAIVSNDTSVEANYAGCLALATNDISATGCGSKVQASLLCQDFACVAACPVPNGDDAAFKAFTQCETNAAAGVCKTYADAAACINSAFGDGGPADQCAPVVNNFGERAAHYIELFCGGTTGDAGLDAPADG